MYSFNDSSPVLERAWAEKAGLGFIAKSSLFISRRFGTWVFLGGFAGAEGKRGGEFYTPSSVVRVLTEMLEPYNGRVYDPCCGSGGMFVQSEKFVIEHGGRIGDIRVYGQEMNNTTWRLAKMNMAVRGMHYQNPPYAEMKLVRCIKGRVWDVAIDLRAGSPTFLKWHAEELTPQNARMLIIPEGFAHGFQVLEADSELLYLVTEYFSAKAEGGIAHNDPLLKINWPLPVSVLSDRDEQHPPISSKYSGVKL